MSKVLAGTKSTQGADPLLERYEPVIGLEVHCQLKTESKLFCSCSTRFGALPNHHTCPICLGMPGALPVLNGQAVSHAVRLALAIKATIHEYSQFSRKQYFYPDLPKGYQITQFDRPYCTAGKIVLGSGQVIRVTRIHIEEDAGKNIHGESSSYVDLNRAGIPLVEIVSEPDIRSSEDTVDYLKRLRSLVRYLDVSDGNLEEGSFRCDVNLSLRPRGQGAYGTRCEIKNLNSFRNIERAIRYEMVRQADILDAGGAVRQCTLNFDAASGRTSILRSKEDSHDYRYFPDPDLRLLHVSRERVDAMERSLPELPEAMGIRFQSCYELPAYDASVLTSDRDLAAFFERTVCRAGGAVAPKIVANWVTSEFLREVNARDWSLLSPPITSEMLGELLELMGKQTISGKIAKAVFEEMVRGEGTVGPTKIIEERGLVQITDQGAIEKVVEEVLARSGEQVKEYHSGRDKIFGYFVGEVMKESKGKMNPALVNAMIVQKLKERKDP